MSSEKKLNCEYKDDYIEIVHPFSPLFDELKKPKINCFIELGFKSDSSWTEEMLDFYKNWNILLNYQKINFYYGDNEQISHLSSQIKNHLIKSSKFISCQHFGFINCCILQWNLHSKSLLMFSHNDTIHNINLSIQPSPDLLFNLEPYTLVGDISSWDSLLTHNHWQESDKPLFNIVKKIIK